MKTNHPKNHGPYEFSEEEVPFEKKMERIDDDGWK